ncbi:MAG: hypothetical protein LBT55_01030 [Clostridiaceae bacterium]|nr:hypothetical protein [Clostridiaceae bacterium]
MKENLVKLIDRLVKRYRYDEPIFTEEILDVWKEYSRVRVAQLLKELTENGVMIKYMKGVYYLPTMTALGRPYRLGLRQVVEKKYIRSEGDVYGYYSGLSLLNSLGLTTQVPNTLEIVTTKETTRVREITIRNSTLILRKARTIVTKDNVYALALLEVMNENGIEFGKEEIEAIREFVKLRGIKQNDVFTYASAFPGKAIKNLLNIGVQNVFAQ